MSELRSVIEQFIEMKAEQRKRRASSQGYDAGCIELREVVDELIEILNGDFSCVEKLNNGILSK